MADNGSVDAFDSNHLWAKSSLAYDDADFTSALFAPLELDIASIRFDHPYAPKHDLDKELRLPDLDAFEFGPLPDLESLPESIPSIDTPVLELGEDVWEAALDLGPANKDRQFYTWDLFDAQNHSHVEAPTPYLSERGPAAFDATLNADADANKAGRVVKGHVLLQSLWNLGLGRSSILFHFNPARKTFEPALDDARPSGISLCAAQSLTAQFIHLGNTVLYLRAFAERVFASANSLPARVALATSISSILSSLEDHLGARSSGIVSLLMLQSLFERPRQIVAHLARMVESVKHAKTNEQLASILHHRILQVEESDGHLRQLSGRILCQVAGPSLELAEEWIGIREEQGPTPIQDRGSFVAVEDAEQTPVEYVYRSEMMPRFISPEDGNTIFETGNSLRFLKTQHPHHPLACMQKYTVQPPQLEWRFEWQDIDAIATKARDYEAALRSTILEFTKGITRESAPPHKEVTAPDVVSDLDKHFELSIDEFNAPPQSMALPDELQLLMHDILNHEDGDSNSDDSFSPPMSITSALSFRPLITAQAKLVNAATLRLFFRSHHLRLHLSLQRQYHLFGDGVFSSLLASALFDPDRESAERHKGKMRSGVHMGLQLGSRTAWPPASSELRLALRGVLSESYYSSALYQSTQSAQVGDRKTSIGDTDSLPGQLNFAIRHLSESEQEKVMDPDALCALDFLRLQYVPPPPLNLVITPAALDKYDAIFKFLLRLSRTLFVVAHLPRTYTDVSARQFRIEAHHFVTTFAAYVFTSGIAEPWGAFEAFVSRLSTRLDDEDAAGELGARVTEGIATLRDVHDECLDAIMFALLLRKRQRKVVALVEEVFEYVLLFAKMQREKQSTGEELEVGELYAKLRGKIRVFLSVCRGLTGKKGYGSKGSAEENSLGRLVTALEMNGYFAG